jgi:hypothetical protein
VVLEQGLGSETVGVGRAGGVQLAGTGAKTIRAKQTAGASIEPDQSSIMDAIRELAQTFKARSERADDSESGQDTRRRKVRDQEVRHHGNEDERHKAPTRGDREVTKRAKRVLDHVERGHQPSGSAGPDSDGGSDPAEGFEAYVRANTDQHGRVDPLVLSRWNELVRARSAARRLQRSAIQSLYTRASDCASRRKVRKPPSPQAEEEL